MSTGPNATPPPPMLSPDRKWVWDGSQWQPVADPDDPARKAVFAAFGAAAQNLPAPVDTARPVPTQVAPPVYSVVKPSGRRPRSAQSSPLLWDRQSTGLNQYLYIAAAAVVVLIGVVVALQFFQISLPWIKTSSSPQTSNSSGPPLTARSEHGTADRYLNGILLPALAALNDTLRPVDTGCTGTMTVACSYALPPADKQLKQVVSLIDGATLPDCIATGVMAIRRDVAGMDANLANMESASEANNAVDVKAYELRYRNGLAALQLDTQAAQAQQANCDATVVGP
jgi:hypothetical protein